MALNEEIEIYFFTGREAIVSFLANKWNKELHYKLRKYLWSFTGNRISVRFEYEWQDAEKKITISEMDNGYRAFARLYASLSFTFIIFVLKAELRLAGCWQQYKNEHK